MGDSSEQSAEFRLLLERANSGEETAFDLLALQATERLRGLARRMLRRYPHIRRWEETDDVFQSALIRLHRSLAEVRPESSRAFFGLAVTQIRRTLIDLARHYYGARGEGTHYRTDAQGRAADDAGGAIDQAPDASEAPETLRQWTAFHDAIESLPAEDGEVFSLVWYSGLAQQEVAELLGVSERTVIRRMNRARLALHDRLEESPERIERMSDETGGCRMKQEDVG